MIRIQSFWRNLFTLLMLCGATAAWAADYVIVSGNNFYNGTSAGTTTFDPQTCIWTGNSGGSFTNKNGTTLTFNSNTSWTLSDGGYISYTSWYYTYYIRYSNNSWTYGTNNSNRATAYEVTSSITATGIEVSSITGDATVTSTSTYSASVVQKNNTQYTWNGSVRATVPADDTAVSGATLTWSVSTNEYATMSNGTLTVSSQPTTTTEVTISVTASYNSMTSPAATKTVKVLGTTPSKPTIEVSLNEVTIESELDTDKIYYTLDGSDPSNASNSNREEYVGEFSLTDEMTFPLTIKAVAYRGSNASSVSTEEVTKMQEITSGTVGKKVVLNDWEDIDNWTYYTGVDESVDGGNYNTNYLGKLYSPGARNIIIEYQGGSVNNASEVAISAESGENQNTMIYYQTVEQGATAGEYPYTVIPNPFSKRPRTNDTTGTNGFWGFGGWKLKEGATYVKGKSTNDVLGLEEDIVFENIPEGSHPKIVFEATWVAATVLTSAPGDSDFTTGTYETNFWVLTGTGDLTNLAKNMTVSARYPDGTVGTNSAVNTANDSQISVSTSFTGTVKLEWMTFNSTGAVGANGRNLFIGRGISNNTNGGALTFVNSNTTVDQNVRIESGKYSQLRHYGASISTRGNHKKQHVILGCDYDRAKGSNGNMIIKGTMYLSQSTSIAGKNSGDELAHTIIKSGSYNTDGQTNIQGNPADAYYYGCSVSGYQKGFRYLEIQGGIWPTIIGGVDQTNDSGTRAFQFRMKGGLVKGAIYGAAQKDGCSGTRVMVITGGTVKGWIAGGANGTANEGAQMTGETFVYFGGNAKLVSATDQNEETPSTNVLNRAVGGNLFGAGCGYNANLSVGEVTLGTNVVVADNAIVERGVYGGGSYGFTTKTSNIYITGGTVKGKMGGVNGTSYNENIHGGVFGGACMNKGGIANIYMTGGVVETGIYGGSNQSGTLSGITTLNILGGTIGTEADKTGKVNGGGLGAGTTVSGNATVTLGDNDKYFPTIYGDVFGGSERGTMSGNIVVTAKDSKVTGGVFGGNNLAGNIDGSITVSVEGRTRGTLMDINNVFGGGNKADYTGSPAVLMKAGNVTGAIYGGAQEANITGNSHVQVTGGSAANIFGGNNISGTISGTIKVDINWTDTNWRNNTAANTDNIGNVYGGGNLAAYNGSPEVNFLNARSTGSVYGGGFGVAREESPTDRSKAVVVGNPVVTIGDWDNTHKVTIGGSVFGGGALAAVEGNPTVTINDCDTKIEGSVYGGGDAAPVYSTTTTIWGGTIKGNVFGGGNGAVAANNSKGAQVGYKRDDATTGGTGNSTTHIYGGTFGTWSGTPLTCLSGTGGIFGGSNTNGNIRGDINIVIDSKAHDEFSDPCDFKAQEAYGAGNVAKFYGSGLNCTIGCVDGISQIFGGAKATDIGTATNPINIQLNISNGTFDKVFGGNNLSGTIYGTIEVNIHETGCKPIVIKEGLYGGGYMAAYEGSPVVNVYSCSYIDKVFGGGLGNTAIVTGNPKVNIFQIPGSYKPGDLNADGNYVPLPEVNGAYAANSGDVLGHIGQVYGGGDQAKVVGSTEVNIATESTLKVTQDATTGVWTATHPADGTAVGANIIGNVYGGGNEAEVTGKATVNIGKK